MPIPSVQPPSVRAVIGEKGENLKGSLVEQGNLGVTVSRKQPFQLRADGLIVLAAATVFRLARADSNRLEALYFLLVVCHERLQQGEITP